MENKINVTEMRESFIRIRSSTPAVRNQYLDDVANKIANLPEEQFENILQELPIGDLTKLRLRNNVERIKKGLSLTSPLRESLSKLTSQLKNLKIEQGLWEMKEKDTEKLKQELDTLKAWKTQKEAEEKAEKEAKEAKEKVDPVGSLREEIDDLISSLDSQNKEKFSKRLKDINSEGATEEKLSLFRDNVKKVLYQENKQAASYFSEISDYGNFTLKSIVREYCGRNTKFQYFKDAIKELCNENSDNFLCKSESNIVGKLTEFYDNCESL